VIFLDENKILGPLQTAEVIKIGKAVRYHEIYKPLGVNTNFVLRTGDNSIQIRTYERGVEDETLACGTGSVASAILSSKKYGMQSPVSVKVQSGEILQIAFDRINDSFKNVTLQGSAVTIFHGEINLDI
jgi:diaminopimelate epimerase